ncbi:MAG: response regulator transcription factor [Bacteriovoracaceae bacterium]|nr:response regulator transcription factor [Bacteriovoracaceae bacterium]
MSSFENIQLLVVEDEVNLADTLSEYLESKGFDIRLARDASQARTFFSMNNFHPQVVLMDIGLPDGDGLDLAREFRSQRKDFVLLFLSAQNDPETKFEGLQMGAEDYITKPFDLRELTLRLERILNSRADLDTLSEEISIGDLKVWFRRFELLDGDGAIIPLGQKEQAILKMLYQRANQVVSRDDIIEDVWGENSFPSNRTVDNYIVKLRKWLESSKEDAAKISSVRGIGYKLEIKGQNDE